MKKTKISIVAAISENRALGKGNKLLWHIPEDLKRFKKLTEGHAVIMGRKTFESIGKPLPKRINIIVTRNKKFAEYVSINQLIDTFVAHSINEAIDMAKKYEKKEIYIAGGAQIYNLGIHYADKLCLTIVRGNFKGDAFFPSYSQFKKVVFRKESQDKNYSYTFFELEK